MSKKLFLLYFCIVSIIFLFSSTSVLAGNDLTVVCPANNKECQLVENLVLFDEKNIAPGYISIPRKLTVINNNPKEECLLAMRTSGINGSPVLLREITFSATDVSHVWYAGSLSNMDLGNEKSLGVIPPKAQNVYQLTASLNQNLGNEYQGLATGFDLDLNFSCQIPIPKPTPTQIMEIQKTAGETTVLGTSTENSLCNERIPQPPILMTTIPGENSVTLVWQESNDPLTYYLVAYGTNPKKYDYGNPNVGGPGTKEYTINGLSADTTYYFAVRAGNGCSPGEFSNQLPGTPNGQIITADKPASGFVGNILGERDYDNTIPQRDNFQQAAYTTSTDQHRNNYFLVIILMTMFWLIFFIYRKTIGKCYYNKQRKK